MTKRSTQRHGFYSAIYLLSFHWQYSTVSFLLILLGQGINVEVVTRTLKAGLRNNLDASQQDFDKWNRVITTFA